MEREILFRGKRSDNGAWVEGHYYTDQRFINGESCQDVYIIRDELHQDHIVNPKTVGQYIGKDDDNSKKIFEGDIDIRGAVVACNKAVWLLENSDGKIIIQCARHIKIIGNIHDNKELCSEGGLPR